MTDKFDYTETGQSDALIYLNSLGTTTFLSALSGVELDGNNAVAYANYVYAKLNPTPNPNLMTYYDLTGQPQPTKGEMEAELKERKDLTEEEIQERINDTMYGGK